MRTKSHVFSLQLCGFATQNNNETESDLLDTNKMYYNMSQDAVCHISGQWTRY